MKNRRTVTRAEAAIEIIQFMEREFNFSQAETAAALTLAAVFLSDCKPENLMGLVRLIAESNSILAEIDNA
jgi:hypothetical protein